MSSKKRGKAASWFLKKRKKAFKEFLENRGQAAMEFLLNYGWVIIVVLVVLAALSYFGILSPSSLMPEKCVVATGVSCADYVVGDDGIQLSLQNSAGRDMVISRIDFVSDALVGDCSTGQIVGLLEDGATKSFAAADPAACAFVDTDKAKNAYDIRIEYSWSESPSITHTFDGELFSGVEADAVIGGGDYTGSGELSGYWAFDVAGQAGDSSGNGNDGAVFGATNTVGIIGDALSFDGINDYISLGKPASINLTIGIQVQYTITAWMYLLPGDNGRRGIFGNFGGGICGGGGYGGFNFDVRDGGLSHRIAYTNGNLGEVTATGLPLIPTNVWAHVAMVRGGSGDGFYINGVKSSNGPLVDAVCQGNNEYRIGHDQNNVGTYFNGTLDEVMIYDRALSYSEIQALYNI